MKIPLASTLHSPNRETLKYVRNSLNLQKKIFSSINIVATDNSNKDLLSYLKKASVNLTTIKSKYGGSSNHRKLVINLALKNTPRAKFVLYIDYDRLLHWIKSYQQELINLLHTFPKTYDFLSIGRTKRAFLTHPKIQQEAEDWTNNELNKLFKANLDTTSGCYILSKKLANVVLKEGSDNNWVFVTDGEWPAISLKNNLKIKGVGVEGLEFETPDFYKDEIKKAGSYQKWLKKYYETSRAKKFRWKIAEETLTAAKKVLGR